jgi:hypothetical protein
MQTLYRTIVMIVTGVLVVKGWQQFGLSTEKVKAGALRALEVAEDALNRSNEPAVNPGGLVADPRAGAPSFSAANEIPTPVLPETGAKAPPLIGEQTHVMGEPAQGAAPKLVLVSSDNMPPLAAADAERLPALLTRLEGLGAAEPQLAAWGSSGELYRFCCRATIGDSASFARHFESVAAEPLTAVEGVIAKLESWRTAQRTVTALR